MVNTILLLGNIVSFQPYDILLQVKSKGPSLINGSHKLEVELCDTSTEHDLIINREMVAAGHARTSPEANKVCFTVEAYTES